MRADGDPETALDVADPAMSAAVDRPHFGFATLLDAIPRS